MNIVFNGEPREASHGTTVAALLRKFKVSSPDAAVEVNLEVVPKTKQEEYQLREGDRVEVVTLVGGG